MIESYPSLYNIGHSALTELLRGDCIVEEKVDGSQFSFGKDTEGVLHARSKGKQINLEDPEKLFNKAIESIRAVEYSLPNGVTYRGEYLAKPHHNVLTYSRTPKNHIILFDITTHGEHYAHPSDKAEVAAQLGFECVPLLYEGRVTDEILRGLLERESILGGQKVEGVVVKPKNYDVFGRDKKVVIAKFVSAEFKEVHAANWKGEHGPKSSNDIIQLLASEYATPARWNKAIQHLRDEGQLTDSPQDIGLLMKEVNADVERECAAEISAKLFAWAWAQLKRSLTRGLPEWYKQKLVAEQWAEVLPETCIALAGV